MTADDKKFLTEQGIEIGDPAIWHEWRDEDVRFLRSQISDAGEQIKGQGRYIAEVRQKLAMWQLAAFAGWGLAIAVMIERATH